MHDSEAPDLGDINPLANWLGWTYSGRDPERDFQNTLASYEGRPVHEPEFQLFSRMDGQKGLFLDVGANMGLSALSLRNVNKTFEILSLEPNPALEPVLARVASHVGRHRFIMTAAGDHDGETTLRVPAAGELLCTCWGSTNPHEFSGDERVPMWRQITGQDAVPLVSVPVKITTIDSLKVQPRVIKIDVEGDELFVLRGGEKTIKRFKPLLMIEHGPNSRVTPYLSGLGYQAYMWAGKLVPYKAGDAYNVFYLTKSHVKELVDK